jgi:hypothetical protein
MPYYHKITVTWGKASLIDEAWDDSNIDENGLYFITRKYIRNGVEVEKLLYVGITTRDFYTRLSEHLRNNSEWSQAYGRKYIRFGTVQAYKLDTYDYKSLLTDLETQIIQSLNKKYPGELLNIQQVDSYTYNYDLDVQHLHNSWLRNI